MTPETAANLVTGIKYFSIALVMLSVVGPALAIGRLAASGLEGISRNPDAAGQIQISMILAIAFAEAIAIYALVVAMLLMFVG